MGGFGKPFHHGQDGVAIKRGKTRDKVQGDVRPGMMRDRQRLEETSRSFPRSLVLCTNRASSDESGHVRDHGRPALLHKSQGPTGAQVPGKPEASGTNMLHLLLPRPLLLILCLLDLPTLPQYSLPLPLSLSVCVIVWAETGVLKSESIPTSCNQFHNQDLYKYSVLPLSHCQIVISALSVYVSSRLLLFRS